MFLQSNKWAVRAEKITQEGRIASLSPTKPTVMTYFTLRPYSKYYVTYSLLTQKNRHVCQVYFEGKYYYIHIKACRNTNQELKGNCTFQRIYMERNPWLTKILPRTLPCYPMPMDLIFSPPNVFLNMNFWNSIFNGIQEIPSNIVFGCKSTNKFASFPNNYVPRILALNSNPMDLNSMTLFDHILFTFPMRAEKQSWSGLALPSHLWDCLFILAPIRVD